MRKAGEGGAGGKKRSGVEFARRSADVGVGGGGGDASHSEAPAVMSPNPNPGSCVPDIMQSGGGGKGNEVGREDMVEVKVRDEQEERESAFLFVRIRGASSSDISESNSTRSKIFDSDRVY